MWSIGSCSKYMNNLCVRVRACAQEDTPVSIHGVLILANKDSSLRVDKPAATQVTLYTAAAHKHLCVNVCFKVCVDVSVVQVEVLSSPKSVQKHVELRQLPVEFGGSFIFSQSSWVGFRLVSVKLAHRLK